MKEAKTETGLALYDEACKLDAGIVTSEKRQSLLFWKKPLPVDVKKRLRCLAYTI